MASRTDLVLRISEAGAIPANRPIDHLRRISTALLIGTIVGTLFGLGVFIKSLSLAQMMVGVIPTLVLIVVVVAAWRAMREPEAEPIPVVARTLATAESATARYVESGANPGLLVPVVVMPVDGSASFRSVILLRQAGKERVEEPAVGTLLPLMQIREGMGELVSADITPEQAELMAKLAKHPRILSNNAPALPMRRGALERKPGWAAVQWWCSIIAGAVLTFGFIWLLR